jgi:iron(III) transport system substrate-binding protein
MPKEWLDEAKKEPPVKILASWDPRQFQDISAPFRERYPDVKINYTRGSLNDRGIRTLVAYQGGRYVADIIASASNTWVDFKAAGGLADLRVLPNFKLLPPENRDANGNWVGQKIAYRCIGYNTNLIKKADLPKTWDDIITNPFWRNGKLAIVDEPSIWLAMLWDAKGPAWTTDFMTKLFTVVKPQLRKEGTSALVGLTAAGETPAFIGAADYRVKQYAGKGAPVSWHCPEPVPVGVSQLMLLKGSPAPKGSLVFLNWFLSKEGQIAQYIRDYSIPVHKDMEQDRRFLPFPDEVIGKKLAMRDEEKLRTEFPKLMAVYEPLWTGAGGAPSKRKAE